MAQYSAGGSLLVNYKELPDALFTAILPHFGVEYSEADRAAMTEAARYDAKTPGFEFEPDSGAKQQASTPTARAAADQWLGDLYRRLEVLRAEDLTEQRLSRAISRSLIGPFVGISPLCGIEAASGTAT